MTLEQLTAAIRQAGSRIEPGGYVINKLAETLAGYLLPLVSPPPIPANRADAQAAFQRISTTFANATFTHAGAPASHAALSAFHADMDMIEKALYA